MTLLRVWRIEHEKTRRGPFDGGSRGLPWANQWREAMYRVTCDLDQWAPPPHNMPLPGEEPLLRGHEDYIPYGVRRYAFPTVRLARRWFGGQAVKWLVERGFVLRAYQVPAHHTERWRSQLRFNATHAVCLSTHGLPALLWMP